VLSDLPAESDARVLVDFRTADDAGVYRLASGSTIVQTVDFFTPIVDDPFTYGQIAASNALSDVYAMGGTPRTALAIAGFPAGDVDAAVIRAVFRGGLDKLREAGVALLGGHTVQDSEIKFGYAVTGDIDPERVLTNAGARDGDLLLLTKPIGTGIVATAIKFGRADAAAEAAAIRSMTALNRDAAEAIRRLDPGDVGACTDITGFGLIGHACEVARASRVTLEIQASAVPLLDGVLTLVAGNTTRGGRTNEAHFGAQVHIHADVPHEHRHLLFDPQTSGGLLLTVVPSAEPALRRHFADLGVRADPIGRVRAPSEASVRITP